MTFFQQIRSLPRPAWIVFGGVFINRFGSFVMPMLTLYLTKSGFSPFQAGLAIGAYGGGHLVASFLGGHMADRIGRRNTIVVSMLGSAAAMLALSQARAYAPIVIITFLAGCAAEMYRPASLALLADFVPPENRTVAIGVYRFAVNLGFAAGPATAGFLADRSFLLAFLGDAVTSVAYGLIAFALLPHGLRSEARDEDAGAVRIIARDTPFLLFLFATVCITLVEFQFISSLALHVTRHGYSAAVYGMLISMNGVLIVLFELAITAYVQRFHLLRAIATGYLLTGIGFALTGVANTLPLIAGTVVIWTLGEMVGMPPSSAWVAKIAPERFRGRYMGMHSVAWSVGIMAGPPLGTLIFERNPAALWSACLLLGVISSVTLFALSRRIAS
ncbi:MAG TPA: MFS transporter [Thermoanaerobaculia bacterium]|nr:MFS transporter [Thermoanaerobaculia bacterium]